MEAVVRLETARALMAAGQARSIRDALVAVESGAAPRVEIAVQDGRVAEALGVVAAQLEAVLESNQRLESEVAALRSEVAGLKALPASERAAVVEVGQRGGESPGESPSAGSGAAEGQPEQIEDASETAELKGRAESKKVRDGLLVRSARWLEHRLRRD